MVVARRVTPADTVRLKRVRLAALQESPSAFGSTYAAESGRPTDEWAERARAGSEGTARTTYFAERDGEVVGLVGAYRDSPSASRVELVSMWVAPSARRGGVGLVLVQAVTEWARTTGAREVGLWVTEGNAAAEALYLSAGFVHTRATKPLPWDPTQQELELTLRIA